jgi:hypothetical protein
MSGCRVLTVSLELQIRGIIVENTFTSMEDLVKHLSPAFSKYMVRAMTNKWDTLSIIGNISKPMLLLSGRADEIVPPRMMTALYKAAILSQGRELAAFPKVREMGAGGLSSAEGLAPSRAGGGEEEEERSSIKELKRRVEQDRRLAAMGEGEEEERSPIKDLKGRVEQGGGLAARQGPALR